ncbi:MAG: cupredoxin domain-containing protein [Dehalococcoidia bacterium]|nr:cupredoxin domain-containing protein [Dehalococcoidia bacterium]
MRLIKKQWVALLPVAILAAASVACGGDNGGNGGAATTAAPTATQGATTPGTPEREIDVLMKDNFFEPTEIRLKVGETVTINAVNEGVAIHNMRILSNATEGKDFASAPLVNPGETSSFDVMFSTAGTFTFQCDFHLPGMVGEVIVE